MWKDKLILFTMNNFKIKYFIKMNFEKIASLSNKTLFPIQQNDREVNKAKISVCPIEKEPLHNSKKTIQLLSDLELMKVDRFLSTKYLAHLFGDSFIRDTVHEGWFSTDGMIHIIRVLKEHPISKLASQVLKNLEECFHWQGKVMSFLCSDESAETVEFDIHKLQTEISEKIYKLEIGESVLIPGGCRGHIALYEILRTHEDQVQFSVFNLGSGSHKHWILVENEGRDSIQGAYILEHVPLKIFVGTDFLTHLLNLKKTKVNDFGHELYEKILPGIGGKRASQPTDPIAYMRVQRSGTCAWKTLLAYLRHKLPLDQYKRFKLLARLDVFEKWSAMGQILDLTTITTRILDERFVNEDKRLELSSADIEFSREELLVLGLIKVKKTFRHYHFLLTENEKLNVKKWYEKITGRDVEKDWGFSMNLSNQKSAVHFEKFA